MKTLVIVLMLASFSGASQITYSHSYDFSAGTCMLNTNSFFYYLTDATLNQCRIYTPNKELYKTIQLDVPDNASLASIHLVSNMLFNATEEVELIYTYYEYRMPDSLQYSFYTTVYANEFGEKILEVPNCVDYELKRIAKNKLNIFFYCYDYSAYPYKFWSYVCNIENGNILQEVPLHEGWNLVSFYTIPNDPSIQNTLPALGSTIETVKNFDNFFDIYSDINNSFTMETGVGYFIKASENSNVYVSGLKYMESNFQYRLKPGWNLIGIPYPSNYKLTTLLPEENGTNISVIKTFSEYCLFNKPSFFTNLDDLTRGKAYLVNAKRNYYLNFEK